MGKHLADKRKPSTGARVKQFMRLARESGRIWQGLWRQPAAVPVDDQRRTQEFLRIARGHRY
ncbi:hypothetical protein [Gemmobacter serpentinus]|uniref:hypothetical protein n=1 Tax=Gemmobacter serpentinus TaxID=2652247 RepID=UPI00124E1007|nr:hypothetical protein [Gemmobacter serpentinus]